MVASLTRGVFIFSACFLLAACSSVKEYHGTSVDNFTFKTELNEADKIRAEVGINRVDKNCNSMFLGRLKLNEEPVVIGIQENSRIIFVFAFVGEGFVNRNTVGKMQAFIEVKQNHRYEVRLVYSDSIFDAIFKETNLQTGRSRVLQPDMEPACLAA
ncbi:MAG: hypothetical protein SV201_00570 [Pseudomonadota bacterium]|nr:hypothetical protein [Pseudomonadota bacterium]